MGWLQVQVGISSLWKRELVLSRILIQDATLRLVATSGPEPLPAATIPDRFEVLPEKPGAPVAKPYESVVVLKPENGNDAHSEIQFWEVGDTEASKPNGKPMKSKIRRELAERLRVVYRR